MTHPEPVTVICRYVVKPGKKAEMETLLTRHWLALHEQGLVTDRRPLMYRGRPPSKPGGRHSAEHTYIEIFEWKEEGSSALAHQSPEVMAVWEPMGGCCSDMDFPHYEPLDLLDG